MGGQVIGWMTVSDEKDVQMVGGWTNRYIYTQASMYAHVHLIVCSNDVIKILKKIITLHVK